MGFRRVQAIRPICRAARNLLHLPALQRWTMPTVWMRHEFEGAPGNLALPTRKVEVMVLR